MTRRKYYYVYRSAVTGRYVPAAFAARNTKTTTRERRVRELKPN